MPEKINFTEEQTKEIIRLYDVELLHPQKISISFNCGQKSIRRILKENNIDTSLSYRKKRLFAEKKITPSKGMLGKTSWNKNLTKETNERVRKNVEDAGKTLKRKFASGELIPYWRGKKSLHLLKRNLENNPSKREDVKEKFRKAREGKTYEEIFGKEKAKKMKEKRANQIFPLRDSSIEIKIQNFLRQLNMEFFTHQYRNEIEHSYQCDIFIPSMNLVIEADGNYWHSYPTGNEIDHIRTSELLEKGFKVLRLWEFEINEMTLEKFKERLNK